MKMELWMEAFVCPFHCR